MPFHIILDLIDQAQNLCDDLFVTVVEAPQKGKNFNRLCRILDRAIQRKERRENLAGF